ncbi:MAG: glycosyltransferase [Anaerolineae bacterium]|nr:glycosyltransferase [Anaerolineae bacterium]
MAHNFYVVIATSGRRALLRRTLVSLSQCRIPGAFRETIVIENGPERAVEDVVTATHHLLNARYMYDPWANKSNALNKVLDTLDDGLIFFTDDDVRIDPDALMTYQQATDNDLHGYYYGGPVTIDYEQDPADWLIPHLPPSARGWQLDETVTGRPTCFLGCNWAAFVKDLKQVGGFDITKGPGSRTGSMGAETAVQLRLYEHSVRARYIPDAVVSHFVPWERCTPVWVLRRLFRTGVTRATWGAVRKWGQNSSSFQNRQIVWAREMLGEVVNGNWHAIFGVFKKSAYLAGYLKGKWITRQP